MKKTNERRDGINRQLQLYSKTAEARLATRDHNKRTSNWVAYAAAAGAAMSVVPAAEAGTIFYVNPQPDFTASRSQTLHVDLNNDAVNDFLFQIYSTAPRTFGAELGGSNLNRVLKTGNFLVRKLASGNTIGAASGQGNLGLFLRFSSPGTSGSVGQFAPSQTGFAGVKLHLNDGDHFGWIRIHVGADTDGFPNLITVKDWAFDCTPGEAIKAGDGTSSSASCTPGSGGSVPEPSSLALLAAGAAGLMAFRKRRNQSARS